ncbi:MAG: hypothetical protein A2817_02960 [Candidatus Yanofskybacteria bacterium RIFCSPHIGHO2_01_FULL_39_8b]|uniref:Glycosyltransferase 2-like domain-containing protein n=1 Tax=Candidatus Yanofskybacteria bacterium RIFCSPHIGHO2_01_FULL_39_8b TaxID=1802659 RepID=A0A1F8EA88_9BACT|nr:MAG: hypothetical protein A2817_02960 [Candidatus Yanofskybacteria bacterium RIFCSPHIGHO2_01_FULL_39_8b]
MTIIDNLFHSSFFVVIPVYNEEKNIGPVIERIKKYTDNIIVVDDGSQDQTYNRAEKAIGNGVILKHQINIGKGAALKTGCEAAIKLGAKIIVMMDGDGQHDSDDIPKLVTKLKNENLDIVFGSRMMDKNIPFIRASGNKIITKTVNLLSRLSLNDILSGFKALTDKTYRKIIWETQDYFVETEIAMNVGKYGLKYAQVPIKTIYKDNYKGLDVISGIKIIFKLLKFKLR